MNIELARDNMIKQQIRTWDVLDETVLNIIAHTPRENFVPSPYKNLAFADMVIPLGHGQAMFSPKEEARLLQALAIQSHEVVLEIGTGSGYLTALLAKLAKYVYSLDIFADFCANAQFNLAKHHIQNVKIINADGANGWSEHGAYDVIVLTGSMLFLPEIFHQSLKPRGRLFAILGKAPAMEATLFSFSGQHEWKEEKLFETMSPRLLNVIKPSTFVF